MNKLNIKAMGLALGILGASYLLLLGLLATFTGWGGVMVEMVGSIYPGYEASILGSIIGAIWAFIDCFVAGVILAWVYNKFA